MKYTTLPIKPVCELQEKVSQLIQSIREIERIVFRERVEEKRDVYKTDYHHDIRIKMSRNLQHFIKKLGEPISCRSYSDGNAYVTWKDDKYEIELIFKNYLFEYIDHEFVNYKPPIEYLKN